MDLRYFTLLFNKTKKRKEKKIKTLHAHAVKEGENERREHTKAKIRYLRNTQLAKV
jgi:hypothetical protein